MIRDRSRRCLRGLAPSVLAFVGCGGIAAEDSAGASREVPVAGTVTLREGDCMPMTTPERCRTRGIAARVEAYRTIQLEKGPKGAYEFVVPPNARPVRTTTSDAQGRFDLHLPEGRYSILTNYDGQWYPIGWQDNGEWARVEVNAAGLEDLELLINRASE